MTAVQWLTRSVWTSQCGSSPLPTVKTNKAQKWVGNKWCPFSRWCPLQAMATSSSLPSTWKHGGQVGPDLWISILQHLRGCGWVYEVGDTMQPNAAHVSLKMLMRLQMERLGESSREVMRWDTLSSDNRTSTWLFDAHCHWHFALVENSVRLSCGMLNEMVHFDWVALALAGSDY